MESHNPAKQRFAFVDGIRGFAIINMIAFHFLYDVFIVYGKNPRWHQLLPTHIWQQFICWTFIIVSGFVWKWNGRKTIRRGIIVNLWGLVISLVTYFAMPSEAIWFGILTFIGCAMLLMIPLHKIALHIPPRVGMPLSFAGFLLFRNVQRGFLGVKSMPLLTLPQGLYDAKILTPFGFPSPSFASSDYFPILPWMFLYLFGYFLGREFMKHEKLKEYARKPIPILSKMGKKSILIYVVHQPICMVVCMLFFG